MRHNTRFLCSILVAGAISVPSLAAAQEPLPSVPVYTAADLARGRQLYETICAACHSANVHWRDKGAADSWPALLEQVKKWARTSGQRWDPAQINDVAAYLNDRFYHYSCPQDECAEKQALLPGRNAILPK